jgi:N-acetylglutamate synthase-like GNAT family acetyltransferase
MDKVEFSNLGKIDNRKQLFELYKSTIGNGWIVKEKTFKSIVFDPQYNLHTDILVAKNNSKVIGFVITQKRNDKSLAEIMLIVVKRSYQRKGVGTELLIKTLERLKSQNINKVQLGGGGYSYFWPGMPDNLPNILSFFRKNGWKFTEESVDMVLDLNDYKSPSLPTDKLPCNLRIEVALKNDANKILAFEKINFPNWHHYFENQIKLGNFENIVVAKEGDGVIGTVLISEENKWSMLLPVPIGAIGALGVVEKYQGKGVGSAMVNYSLNKLIQKNFKTVYLGWTYLVDWYSKFGFKIWRKYQMSWKKIQ